MTLRTTATWKDCSIDHMHSAFLQAERSKFMGLLRPGDDPKWIDEPDLTVAAENAARKKILDYDRGFVLAHVPLSDWFCVEYLRDQHLDELRVIRAGEWCQGINAPAGDRRLSVVAPLAAVSQSKGELVKIRAKPSAPVILWAHSQDGPFTILEGNHRLNA